VCVCVVCVYVVCVCVVCLCVCGVCLCVCGVCVYVCMCGVCMYVCMCGVCVCGVYLCVCVCVCVVCVVCVFVCVCVVCGCVCVCVCVCVWVVLQTDCILLHSQLMLCSEIVAVCSQIHTKHTNTLCGQNVELLTVKASGTYSQVLGFKRLTLAPDGGG